MFVWIACTFKVLILLHKLHDKQCGIWKLEAPDCSLHYIKNRLPNVIVSIIDELGIWITSCWSRVISAELLQIKCSLLSVVGCLCVTSWDRNSTEQGAGAHGWGSFSALSEAQAGAGRAWELHSNCSAWAFPGSCHPAKAVLPCCKEALGQGNYQDTTETPHIVQRFCLTLNRQVVLTEISVLSAAAWSHWCAWLLQLPNPLCTCAFHSVSRCHSTLHLHCVLICCLVTLLLCFSRVSSVGFLISYVPFPCSETAGRCSNEYWAFCNF